MKEVLLVGFAWTFAFAALFTGHLVLAGAAAGFAAALTLGLVAVL